MQYKFMNDLNKDASTGSTNPYVDIALIEEKSYINEFSQETNDSNRPENYDKIIINKSIFGPTKSVLKEITDDGTKENIIQLIQLLSSVLSNFELEETFPSLTPNIIDEKTILLEWIFPNYRLAFYIDNDKDNSDWSLFSKKSHGGFQFSGQLFTPPARNAIFEIINSINH